MLSLMKPQDVDQQSPVTDAQRFTREQPCPICGGCKEDPQGQQTRCWGFLSSKGEIAYCTREEYSKGLLWQDAGFPHRLRRPCKCGVTHSTPSWWLVGQIDFLICDITGEVRATHIRYDYPSGAKDFRWPQGSPRPATLPLYGTERLASVPRGSTVVVVEGEKKVEMLLARNIAAVSTITGAPMTHDVDAFKVLLDFAVVLWGDADAVGVQQRIENGERLRAIGHQTVREIIKAPSPDDYFAQGNTVGQALALLDQAMPVGPTPTVSWGWATVLRGAQITATRVIEPDALVRGLFTRNRQHAIIGASGSAKTWVEFDLAVCVACPEIRTFLGQPVLVHGPVVIESWEQGQPEDLRRLQKLLRGYARAAAPDTLILASEPALTLNDDAAYQARLRDFVDAGVVLYAFDSLSEGCGIELNDNTAYTAWWRARVAPTLKANITVVFTHLRGHITGKPGVLADRDAVFRGATQIRALSQAAIECRQLTETSSLLKHNKYRDTPALPFGTLNLVGGFEDPEIRLSLVAPLAADVVKNAKMKKLLDWLKDRPGSSKRAIKKGVGFGQDTVDDLVGEGTKLGLITALDGPKGVVYSTAPDFQVRSEYGAVDSDEESDG